MHTFYYSVAQLLLSNSITNTKIINKIHLHKLKTMTSASKGCFICHVGWEISGTPRRFLYRSRTMLLWPVHSFRRIAEDSFCRHGLNSVFLLPLFGDESDYGCHGSCAVAFKYKQAFDQSCFLLATPMAIGRYIMIFNDIV